MHLPTFAKPIQNPNAETCGGWADKNGNMILLEGEELIAKFPTIYLHELRSDGKWNKDVSAGGIFCITNRRITYLSKSFISRLRDTYRSISYEDVIGFDMGLINGSTENLLKIRYEGDYGTKRQLALSGSGLSGGFPSVDFWVQVLYNLKVLTKLLKA